MPKKALEHLQNGPLAGARALVQKLGSKDYTAPLDQDLAQWQSEDAETEDPSNPAKRTAKIRFNKGLGWCEETQSWWIHIRAGEKFHTLDTEEKKYDGAEIWLKNFKKTIQEGADSGEIPGLTLEEGLRMWVKTAPLDYSYPKRPSLDRVRDVDSAYKRWVLPKLGRKKVKKVTTEDLNELIQDFRDGYGPNGKHKEEGVRNFIINLNTIFRWLYKSGKISHIPRLPAVPKRNRKNPVIVPFDKVWELIERFDQRVGYDIYAMAYIRVLAFCGVRTENTRTLDKEQFNDTLTVFNTGPTKNQESYNLPIPEEVREYLLLVPNIHQKPGLLISNVKGEKRSYGWSIKAFKAACKDVGITYSMAWHRLRATCATMMTRAGADPFLLMKALGWKTIEAAHFYISTETEDIARIQRKGIDGFRNGATSRQ